MPARRNRHGLVNLARQIVMPTMTADERIPLDEAEGRIEGRKLSEIESNSTPENPDEMGERSGRTAIPISRLGAGRSQVQILSPRRQKAPQIAIFVVSGGVQKRETGSTASKLF